MSLPNLPCIAPGHDNPDALTPFAWLSPPLFRRHLGHAVKMTWHGYQGRALTGDRLYKTWGLPSVDWTFGVLSREERLYLGAHYPDFVTARVFNEDSMTWENVNATLLHPDLGATTRQQRKWTGVVYTLIDLVAL